MRPPTATASARDWHQAELERAQLLSAADSWLGAAEGAAALESLAALLVPSLGDFCAIDRLLAGRLIRAAVVHREADRAWALRELGAGELPELSAPALPPAHVARSGEPALHPELPDPALAAMSRDDRELQLLRELAPTSSLAVPLWAGGVVRGVLWLGTSSSARRLGPRELALVEQVAVRAAAHLERERLLDEARLERERLTREAERDRAARLRAEADRERLLFELRDALQVRETFLTLASHELRTPLTGLQLAVQSAALLVSKLPISQPAEQAVSRLGIADKQVHRLCTLIDRVLDLARIELGA